MSIKDLQVAAADMTDEELWNSPIGERLRHYADKLLAAEQARLELFTRNRANQAAMMAGAETSREVISPLGGPFDREDAWATYRSPELEKLRGLTRETDGTVGAVQEAAKAYIASLPSEGPSASAEKKPVTTMDVAGALSYLLTGHAASDRGPFAVHEGDGFHNEPYVMLPLDAMRRVLDEIPESRW